jgi:4-amino-4-deoxy-L-arabinose transferase-like glycosyltransferase
VGAGESSALLVLTLACAASSAALVFLLARLLGGARFALLAALGWMTYPLALWSSKQPNSENPFMVIFLGALLVLWRALLRPPYTRLPFLASGLLIGYAMLVRPAAIGLGLVLALMIWFACPEAPRRLRARLIAVFLLGNLVAVLPWELFVLARTGQLIPLSANGVAGIRDGLTFAVAPKSYRLGQPVPPDVEQVMRGFLAQHDQLQTPGDLIRAIGAAFREHPVAMLKFYAIKALRSWYGTDSGRFETALAFLQIVYLAVIARGTRRLYLGDAMARRMVLSFWGIAFYFWLMTILVLSIVRYMLPAIGLLLVLLPAAFVDRDGRSRLYGAYHERC